MKLRITSDELRVRLDAADIASLSDGRGLRETLTLADQQFQFALVCDGTEVGACFSAEGLQINVPGDQAVRWAVSDEEILSTLLAGGSRLSIEKDKHR